jgi:small conductance mechanosensitive channel
MEEAIEKLLEKLNTSFEHFFLLIPNIVLSIIIALAGFFAVRFIHRRIRKFLDKHLDNPSISFIVSKVVAFVLIMGLIFLILGILSLDKLLTSLLATAGVLGLAIGLALQDPLTNAFSGIMLSARPRLRIGNLIESNGYFGYVTEINLRSMVIHTLDGQVVTIPNKSVLQNPIINFTALGKRRIELECGISYAENLDQVEAIAMNALKEVEHLDSEKTEFYFTSFGDYSIQFKIRFWINKINQAAYLNARSEILRKIKKAFDEQGILIPFPIRTIDFAMKGGRTLREEIHIPDPGNGVSDQSG